MSLELAKEIAANAYEVLMDAIRDAVGRNGNGPNVIHVSKAVEQILIAHMTLNCDHRFEAGGVRGMYYIMGLRPVWDAPRFKLEREEWATRSIRQETQNTMSPDTQHG